MLTDLSSFNRDINFSLYWRSIQLASKIPDLDICFKGKVFLILGIEIKEKRNKGQKLTIEVY